MTPITVLLVDDHVVVREGLQMLLEAVNYIEVVGEASTGRQAVDLVKKLRPAVVVMDIAMPNLNGLEATQQILKVAPSTRVIILSAHSDDIYIDNVNAIGAAGYIVKQNSAQYLIKAIQEVHKGRQFFSPFIQGRLAGRNGKSLNREGQIKKKNVRLSSREAEILQLIAEGDANKQIASELEISIKTVEKHRQNLMEKLDIHDVAGLTRYAISTGVIDPANKR